MIIHWWLLDYTNTQLTARRQIITVTKRMAGSIEGVYLVEKSEVLRDAQHRLLCGDEPMVRTESGWRSRSSQLKHLDIVWCEDLRDVPQSMLLALRLTAKS